MRYAHINLEHYALCSHQQRNSRISRTAQNKHFPFNDNTEKSEIWVPLRFLYSRDSRSLARRHAIISRAVAELQFPVLSPDGDHEDNGQRAGSDHDAVGGQNEHLEETTL